MNFIYRKGSFRTKVLGAMRTVCQSGLLGIRYPPEFSIRTCLQWTIHHYERVTLDYLTHLMKPGDVFVDIGAHIGYFAKYVGQLVGTEGSVYAFEPHPSNYERLVRNCRSLPQVKTIRLALSDSSGKALLFTHPSSSSSHALQDLSGCKISDMVSTVSFDDWASQNNINRVHVALIDVEGHELSVLRGMQHTVEQNPNTVLVMEYCPANWVSKDTGISELIKGIYDMHLGIHYALGQTDRYVFSAYKSIQEIHDALSSIVEKETEEKHVDYVNIVVSRFF